MAEESFHLYLIDWQKKYALLLQSIDFENKRMEELDRKMIKFSTFNSIMKIMNNDQPLNQLQRNLDTCKRDFESFKFSTLAKKPNYEYTPLKLPVFHDLIDQIQIYVPSEVDDDLLEVGSDGIPNPYLEQGIFKSHLRRKEKNPFHNSDNSYDDSIFDGEF